MSKSRYVKDSIRSDNWFTDLGVSEKLLFIYLLTNDKVGLCGVYELPFKKIQWETGIDSGTIGKAFERFESVGKVCYRNGWVMVTNFLRNQSMNDNMVKGAKREAENIKDEVWLSFADWKGFERLGKDFESFDILNFTLLNFTLLNLTKPNVDTEGFQNNTQEKNNATKVASVLSPNFSPPSLEQVEEYCNENNYGVDAQAFLDHYNIVGWRYGKNKVPIKDWKACVRTWNKRSNEDEKLKEPAEHDMEGRRQLRDRMGIKAFTEKYGNEKARAIMIYLA